jgi:hypothetical protein
VFEKCLRETELNSEKKIVFWVCPFYVLAQLFLFLEYNIDIQKVQNQKTILFTMRVQRTNPKKLFFETKCQMKKDFTIVSPENFGPLSALSSAQILSLLKILLRSS